MSDTYQAVYDAIRSRITGCDLGNTVEDIARNTFDISHEKAIALQEFCTAAAEMMRPSVLFRPRIYMDGNQWCALYGENLQDGIAGFGDSPAKAMADFDRHWNAGRSRAEKQS